MFNWLKHLFSTDTSKSVVSRLPLPHTKDEKDAFIKRYLEILIENGWKYEGSAFSPSNEEVLNRIHEKFDFLDPDLVLFLSSFKDLVNETQNVWYIDLDSEKDMQEDTQEEGKRFWDNHFPIMESMVIEDSTISVVLRGKDRGKFVYCNENIYEDAEIIADDFFSFLQLHAYSVELGSETYKNNALWAFV